MQNLAGDGIVRVNMWTRIARESGSSFYAGMRLLALKDINPDVAALPGAGRRSRGERVRLHGGRAERFDSNRGWVRPPDRVRDLVGFEHR